MKTRSWSTRAAILAVAVLGALLFVGPALAAGPSKAGIFVKNPAAAGEAVDITVVITGTFQSPAGLVQLFDGLSPLGPPLVLEPDFDKFLGCKCVPTDHSHATLTRSFSEGNHPLTVDYTGDGPLGNFPIFGGGFVLLVVTAAQSVTSVTSSANPSVYGQSVTFTATAMNGGAPAAGSIQFKADGADLGGPVAVAPDGTATVSTTGQSVANHPVTADFTSGDPNVRDSVGTLGGGQTVNAANTSTSVSSSVNPSEYGAATIFSAVVSTDAPGAGDATGAVQFAVDGAPTGSPSAVTGGQASFSSSSLSVGSHTISATFTSSSANFDGSTGSIVQIVNRARTTLSYDGATSVDFDDPGVLSARLTRTYDGSALVGSTVHLAMGSETCSASTDSNGEATCTITPAEPAALYTASASYDGDANYLASSGGAPFTVTKEETTLAYRGPTVIAQGSPVVLSARLTEDALTGIAGRSLTLTIGTGAGSQSCEAAPTSVAGVVSCTVANVSIPQGAQPVQAAFHGDAYYLPSSDSASLIVFAFPSRGVFALGARAAATAVTFWSPVWAALNDATAPDAFKGFAAGTTPAPPACGGTWNSSPANSPPPPETIPSYMGTIVTGPIARSGAAISGRIVKIVVVKTNGQYAPSPGHIGTGSIVATYC